MGCESKPKKPDLCPICGRESMVLGACSSCGADLGGVHVELIRAARMRLGYYQRFGEPEEDFLAMYERKQASHEEEEDKEPSLVDQVARITVRCRDSGTRFKATVVDEKVVWLCACGKRYERTLDVLEHLPDEVWVYDCPLDQYNYDGGHTHHDVPEKNNIDRDSYKEGFQAALSMQEALRGVLDVKACERTGIHAYTIGTAADRRCLICGKTEEEIKCDRK